MSVMIRLSLIGWDKDHKQVLRKVGWNSKVWRSQCVESQLSYSFCTFGRLSWMHPVQLIYSFGEIRIIGHLFLTSPTPILRLGNPGIFQQTKRVLSDKITTKTLRLRHFSDTAIWNIVVPVFSIFTTSVFYAFRYSWYSPRNMSYCVFSKHTIVL
jgi:hypothetical protein